MNAGNGTESDNALPPMADGSAAAGVAAENDGDFENLGMVAAESLGNTDNR